LNNSVRWLSIGILAVDHLEKEEQQQQDPDDAISDSPFLDISQGFLIFMIEVDVPMLFICLEQKEQQQDPPQ